MTEIDSTDNGEEIDVPAVEEGEQIERASQNEPPPLSSRDAIFAAREEQLLSEVNGEAKVPDPQAEAIQEPPKLETVKVKIDGSEEEVSLDDLKRHYQKSEAADRRLQQAALEARRIDEERQRLQAEREQFEQLRQQASTAPDTTLEELRQQRRDAMEIGDYDEFDRLDEEISRYRQPQQPPVDPMQIANYAKEQALVQMQYDTAYKNFVDKNNFLVQDEVLYNITMNTFNNVCKESTTYDEAFAKTEALMKDWISSVAPSNEKSDSAMTARQERKQSIQAEPGRLNIKSTLPPANKEETASDIIANMRKARGLPV